MKLGRRVHHRAPKWELGTVWRRCPDVGPHAVDVVVAYSAEGNPLYRPMSLPGEPQLGDTVELGRGYFGERRQSRCRVAGREYVFIAPGPVWQALDTGEIISMW